MPRRATIAHPGILLRFTFGIVAKYPESYSTPEARSIRCLRSWTVDAETLRNWANLVLSGAVTIILIPLAVYFVRYYWDRRRWHALEKFLRTWSTEELDLPDDLSDEDWNALAATMLNEAGFEPDKIKDLCEPAVWFAKGLASRELRGRI